MKQLAYEVLRQEDCRRNQLEDFCSRNFAAEYLEYERMRQDYLQDEDEEAKAEEQWRVSQNDAKLDIRQN